MASPSLGLLSSVGAPAGPSLSPASGSPPTCQVRMGPLLQPSPVLGLTLAYGTDCPRLGLPAAWPY